MKKLLILTAILAALLLFAWETRAQDPEITTIPIGRTIDYPHVYILVDTVHNMSQVYNYYHCKMWFSVNGGKATLLPRAQVMTVWSTAFTLTVSRKKYRKTYNI